MMSSQRSKRLHKPTKKFLNYVTEEIGLQGSNVLKKEKSEMNENCEVLKAVKKKNMNIKKPLNVKTETKEEDLSSSSSESVSKESLNDSIRRSSRKHKPNQKFKEFFDPAEFSTDCPRSKSLKRARRDKEQEDAAAPSKKLRVDLVDCFNKKVPKYNLSGYSVDKHAFVSNDDESEDEGSFDESSDDTENRLRGEGAAFSVTKHRRLTPSAVRALTKTRKSAQLSGQAVLPQRAQVVATRRNATPSNVSLKSSKKKTAWHSPVSSETDSGSRDAALKFVFLGTKVADAMKDSLKQDDEMLVASAFENDCVGVVHSMAKRGGDLESADAAAVLRLLEREKQRRRSYRRLLTKTLRTSHLTNMALYTQILILLKGL